MPNTPFLPGPILSFESLPSTNDYLRQLLTNQDPVHGTVVWAREQTRGKGQNGHAWESSPGENLTLSILLKPSALRASEAFRLSKGIALAVRDTLAEWITSPVLIKWPNDILIGTNKISGILIENSIQGEFVRHSIVGIGININQTHFNPAFKATSLRLLTTEYFDMEMVMGQLLKHVGRYMTILASDAKEEIERSYFRHLCGIDKPQKFNIGGSESILPIQWVNPDGSIVLGTDDKKAVYLHGDAQWVR